jgi:hypothetical protein
VKKRESEDVDSVVVDVYGIKLRASAADLGEEPPRSWAEVREQLRGHLYRIAAGPTRLAAEVLEGATRLVRGLARLPMSINKRIESAHAEADRRERRQQEVLLPTAAKQLRMQTMSAGEAAMKFSQTSSALKEIEAILERYRAQGNEAYVVLAPNGAVIVVLGAPPDSDAGVRYKLQQAAGQLITDGAAVSHDVQ